MFIGNSRFFDYARDCADQYERWITKFTSKHAGSSSDSTEVESDSEGSVSDNDEDKIETDLLGMSCQNVDIHKEHQKQLSQLESAVDNLMELLPTLQHFSEAERPPVAEEERRSSTLAIQPTALPSDNSFA